MGREGNAARRRRQLGVSLPELLVVIALLALTALVTIPITTRRVSELRLRAAADEFVVVLRAQRMLAVTRGRQTRVEVSGYPENRYEYTSGDGRLITVEIPGWIRIDPASTPLITFRPNGSLATAAATVRFEGRYENLESWTIRVPANGVPRSEREPWDSGHP